MQDGKNKKYSIRLNCKWKVYFSFKIQRTGVIFRFKYGTNKDVGLPKFIFNYVGSKMLKETVAQGYGRHSKEEGFIDFFLVLKFGYLKKLIFKKCIK